MSKRVPPEPDDPRYRRTCTRCYTVRNWRPTVDIKNVMSYACPACGNFEFMLPRKAKGGSS